MTKNNDRDNLKAKVSIFWFRRDLRLEDNHGLYECLKGDYPVLPIFIFDIKILEDLPKDDARVTFIYEHLIQIHSQLKIRGGSLYCKKGYCIQVWEDLLGEYDVQGVYFNEDYDPYVRRRDEEVIGFLDSKGMPTYSYKDQVVFAKSEILKSNQQPYTIFTPYKNKWIEKLEDSHLWHNPSESLNNLYQTSFLFPTLDSLGFYKSDIKAMDYDITHLDDYEAQRDIPLLNATSHLSTHLRFGTVSIRSVVRASLSHPVFLSELIWREFFMQILYHYPKVTTNNFRAKYNNILWRNSEEDFEKWKHGKTGYPLVDAGMRELNTTGYMHNRVRMITAGFLCKHLLIDWRWGEAYFAEKLLDYDRSSNNGNWQWAAGTGCDAAPYFRVFNPTTQLKKFDPKLAYVKHWIPELETSEYPSPMIEHGYARERALKVYKEGTESLLSV